MNAQVKNVFGVVNIGSFHVSAMVAGQKEDGSLVVLGSGHRAAQGVKRGYITDMVAASYAVRDTVEHAERMANTSVRSVWMGCSGSGLASQVVQASIDIGGRRIEQSDIDTLLATARGRIDAGNRMLLHAQPAHYTIDGARGISRPLGLHADRLNVDVHAVFAETSPIRNLIEAVQGAHLEIEGVVASPIAAGYACLTEEERELGVALVEVGADITNVSVFAGGMLVGFEALAIGSADITDAIASGFGLSRSEAERLKCVKGSAITTPSDHREMIAIGGDSDRTVSRAELGAIIAGQLARIMEGVTRALKELGFTGVRGQPVVLTGGGAELIGIVDYAQAALGRPTRIGRAPAIAGLAETHHKPGYTVLAGLALYVEADPVDIRSAAPSYQPTMRYRKAGLVNRVVRAVRDYF